MTDYLARILATGVVAVFVSAGVVLFVAGVLALGGLIPFDDDDK